MIDLRFWGQIIEYLHKRTAMRAAEKCNSLQQFISKEAGDEKKGKEGKGKGREGKDGAQRERERVC